MKMSSVQESEVRTLLKNKCTADRLPDMCWENPLGRVCLFLNGRVVTSDQIAWQIFKEERASRSENTPPKFLLFKPMITYLDSNPLGEHTAYTDHPNHPGFMKPSTMMNVPVFTHGTTGQQFFLFFMVDEKKDTHLAIRLLEDLPEDLYKLVPSTFIPTAAPMQQTQSPDEATK